MKSPNLSFFQNLLAECGRRCSTDTSADFKTVERRTEHEGMSFLTITLGSFRSHFELSLDQGSWQPGLSEFSQTAGLPKFLRGFLLLVFGVDGVLLEDPSIEAIRCIRQLTGVFQKVLMPTSSERDKAAIDKFIECENELGAWEDSVLPSIDLTLFDRVVSCLYAEMFSNLDRKIWTGEFLPPKHGPGSTADRLIGNQKWSQDVWPERLQYYFPMEEYLYPNFGWHLHSQSVEFIEPGAELPVKITLVPKTLKTPRIIAIEPTAMQYAQQALLAQFVEQIEGDPLLHDILSWSSQIPNQKMARQGSQNGELATLDLSEASDRVSNALVNRMLKRFPHLRGAVMASRTTSAKLPTGEIITDLRKFASMGSALCFPMESMLFVALILMGCMDAKNITDPRKAIKALRGQIRTFGDDIICPTVCAEAVADTLETFGLKVNQRKSFWTGKFRESCGKDYYAGSDVSYIKVRREFPTNRDQSSEIVSLVSLRNQLFTAGFFDTCELLDRWIRKLIPFPNGTADTGALVALTNGTVSVERFCPNLHVPMVKAGVVKVQIPTNSLDEHGALMKHFLKPGKDPFQDVLHLINSGRAVSLYIRTQWVPLAP